MASYFEEHDCDPGGSSSSSSSSGPPSVQLRHQQLMQLARSLFNGLEIDLGSLESGDWEHRLPPPAAKKAVDALPSVRVTPSQADKSPKCPVCLLEFEEEETVRKMPCQHLFHSGCLLPWLGKTNSCPLCRHELPTDDEEYEEYKKDKLRKQQQAHRLEYLHGAMYT
ncbi:E3 ubiquitin-protein ligase RNF181 [Sceloporus undulatus]|uniref:E3 ubiquitin-protein ligase RNF181 n=1 Tax=Sceloporus undulatus TaxID=8520 RepID=UPI001C4B92BF|nr:E3 ubiquitin-protein ligase RNF181 [Sceloporus undulatus]